MASIVVNVKEDKKIFDYSKSNWIEISISFHQTRELVTIKRNKGREETVIETEALSLVNSSNILVTKLSNYGKNNSEYLSLFKESLQF